MDAVPRPGLTRTLRSGSIPDLVAIAAYLGLAIVFTFPLIADLSANIDARFDGIDPRYILSTLEWERFALLHAPGEFFAGNIFFGSGGALFSSDLLLGALPLYVLLRLPFAPVLAFNLLYVIAFFLNAVIMYLAVHSILRHRPAAFLAGLIFAFAPLPLHHATHIQLNFAWWIPLALLFAIRYARYLRWRDFAVAVLLVAIAGVTAVQLGFIAAIVVFAFGLVPGLMLAYRRRVWRPALTALLAAALVAVPFIPIALGYLDFAGAWGIERTADQVARLASRVPDYLATGDRYRWFDFLGERFSRESPERTLFPGFLPILLALAGARLGFVRGNRLRGLTVITLLVALLAFVLAFGVRLDWSRFGIDWPLPYAFLFDNFGPLRSIQAVGRFSLLLNFSFAILAAIALQRVASRPTHRIPVWLPGAAVAALLLVESFPAPLPTAPAPVNGHLLALLESRARGPTLILPITRGADIHTRVWTNTLAGNGALVYGYSGERWPVLDGYDRAIVGMSSAEMDATLIALRAAGIRRLVIFPNLLTESDALAWAALARHPLVATVVGSGEATLYELAESPVSAVSGWSDIEARLIIRAAAPGSAVRAPLILTNPGPGPWVPPGGAHRRTLSLAFQDSAGNTVTGATSSFMPPPFLPAGATLELPINMTAPTEPGHYAFVARVDADLLLSQTVSVESVATSEFDGTLTGFAAEIQLASLRRLTLYPGEAFPVRVNALNTGSTAWGDPEIFRAGGRVYRIQPDGARELLPGEWRIVPELDSRGPIVAGAGYSFSGRIDAPEQPGEYVLTVGFVAERLGWLATLPVEIQLTVLPPP